MIDIPLAYLNLGSGSYVIQLIIASILGMLVVLRVYWKGIVDSIRKFTGRRRKG